MDSKSSKLGISDSYPLSPFRILLDGRKVNDGGIGVYTENLILGLLAQEQVRLSVILPSRLLDSGELEKREWFSSVNIIKDDSSNYSLDEAFRLAKRINQSDYDLYHIPHYTLPYGFKIPSVVTVHDLIHVSHPERLYYPFVARHLVRSALRRATRILTVSQASYNDLTKLARGRSKLVSKVRVVPNALDPFFLKSSKCVDYLAGRYKLRGDYILAVFSMLKPHKGLKDLLRAFRAIKEGRMKGVDAKRVSDLKLVLVGKGTEKLVEKESLLEKAGSIKGVYVYGSVSKEELLNLYGGALGLVIPSLAEGFSIPVLEAQAQGTPVLARPVPAIKELLTKRDVLCTDFSSEALEEGLWELLKRNSNGDLHRGWPNLKRFAREDIGRTILQVYMEAISEFSPEKIMFPADTAADGSDSYAENLTGTL